MGYLQRHPRPKLVVLCASPFCFEVDIGTAGGDFPERFVANFGPEVSGVVPVVDSLSYFIKRGAVSVLNGSAREVRDDPLDGFPRETYRTLAQKLAASRGFVSLPGEHGPQRGVDRPGPENIVNADWTNGFGESRSPANLKAFRCSFSFLRSVRNVPTRETGDSSTDGQPTSIARSRT
jgi:hypothetical protein